jgi:soluble lytic murein transglycosylase-like protein
MILMAVCLLGTIECQILKNKPIPINKAINLAYKIKTYSRKYNISPSIYAAILMQESSYRLNAKACQKSCDWGIAQINDINVKYYKLDKNRLLNDLDYSLEKGAMVLSWFSKTYSKKEKLWYLRYNCGTRKKIISKVCQTYYRKLKRWF